MSTPARSRLSYTEYSRTPNDGKRYEFLGGEVYASPTPSLPHQYASTMLFRQLDAFFQREPGERQVFFAPLTVILHDTPPEDAEIVVPDLLIVEDARTGSHRGIEGPPLVAIEITCPNRPWMDRTLKYQRYAANGVRHYWIVDPDQESMECFRLSDGAYLIDVSGSTGDQLTVSAFPGLTLDLGAFWLPFPSGT